MSRAFFIIAVDFDGTCVTHDYPRIGREIGAAPVLRRIVKRGHFLVLNTMRSGDYLTEASQWFGQNDIPLYGINQTPGQRDWTRSPKVHADYYIDDRGVGIPLIKNELSLYPFVDWVTTEKLLRDLQVL